MKNSWIKDLLFLTLIVGALYFILLGVRPLSVPDEGRYAEIAREMVATGDYVTPYLNGIKYFEKPIFFYWLESFAIHLTGLNIWSLRSVNAFFGLLGCLLTYLTTRKLYNRETGFLAALILGTSALYFVMSHMISLDLPVTFFIMLSLYLFLLGTQYPYGRMRRFSMWGASVSAACAVLTKGLIGLLFPGMIITIWIAITNNWRLLTRLYLPSSLLIFLIIAVPWHILVGERNHEFFYFYFINQHFLRYTNVSLKIGHYQPTWFFIPILILGFFPWIVFLPQTVRNVLLTLKERDKNKIELFLLIWATTIFIFFSFSKSKLIPYILPIFPPLAILIANHLQKVITDKKLTGFKISYLCLLLFAVYLICVFFIFLNNVRIPEPQTGYLYLSLAALSLLIGTSFGYFHASLKPSLAIKITIATSFLFLLFINATIPSVDTRSIKPLAEILKPILRAEDDVVTYNQYYQDLPFYLQKRISVLNWRNELKFGMQHQVKHEWMINDDLFWQRWNSSQRVFAIMSLHEYQKFLLFHPNCGFLLGQTSNNVLISNKSNF